MKCQQCLDQWGAVPSEWGDTQEEGIAYFKHLVFHTDYEGSVPWFWESEIYDERQ